jgi:hypothetical protein
MAKVEYVDGLMKSHWKEWHIIEPRFCIDTEHCVRTPVRSYLSSQTSYQENSFKKAVRKQLDDAIMSSKIENLVREINKSDKPITFEYSHMPPFTISANEWHPGNETDLANTKCTVINSFKESHQKILKAALEDKESWKGRFVARPYFDDLTQSVYLGVLTRVFLDSDATPKKHMTIQESFDVVENNITFEEMKELVEKRKLENAVIIVDDADSILGLEEEEFIQKMVKARTPPIKPFLFQQQYQSLRDTFKAPLDDYHKGTSETSPDDKRFRLFIASSETPHDPNRDSATWNRMQTYEFKSVYKDS